MKVCLKFLLLSLIFSSIWAVCLCYTINNNMKIAAEIIKGIPGHFLISVGYYALVKVCYNILFISDCKKEYSELVKEIEEGREFFRKKGIKYN